MFLFFSFQLFNLSYCQFSSALLRVCVCTRVNITTYVCVYVSEYVCESGRACSADRYRCSHVRVPISNDCKSGTLGQYYYSCTNKHTHSAQRNKRIHGTSDTHANTHTQTHTDANLSHTFRIAWSFFPRGCSVHIHVSRTTEAEAETGTTLRHNAFALTHTHTNTCKRTPIHACTNTHVPRTFVSHFQRAKLVSWLFV